MRSYIIRRILLMIPTVFLTTIILFFGIRLLPGSIIDTILADASYYEETLDRAALEAELGLDAPIIVQYGRWIGVAPHADGRFSGLLQGDLGTSLRLRIPVREEIGNRWTATLELGLLGLIMGQIISVPVGIYSGIRQDTAGDYAARSFAVLAMAIPGFWLGTLLVIFPAIWWGYMPPLDYIPFLRNPLHNLEMMILPAICVGLTMTGTTMRLTRTMMLEVMRQDYVRTAWAKGLRERKVVLRHALKNAMIPVITVIGLRIPVLISGAVVIEQIFLIPGMGRLIVDATQHRDYTVVNGILLIFAVFLVFVNLLVDLTYGFLDPRIHYK